MLRFEAAKDKMKCPQAAESAKRVYNIRSELCKVGGVTWLLLRVRY